MAKDHAVGLKEKAKEEMRLLVVISVYLLSVFGAFVTYRRLVLREFGVTAFHYGFAALEAVIVAKVILIGRALGVGRKEGRSLAAAVLRQSFLYGLLVMVFTILEHVLESLTHHKGLKEGIDTILNRGLYEVLGRTLILFVALIPFFAFWELCKQLGEENVFELLFRRRTPRAGS